MSQLPSHFHPTHSNKLHCGVWNSKEQLSWIYSQHVFIHHLFWFCIPNFNRERQTSTHSEIPTARCQLGCMVDFGHLCVLFSKKLCILGILLLFNSGVWWSERCPCFCKLSELRVSKVASIFPELLESLCIWFPCLWYMQMCMRERWIARLHVSMCTCRCACMNS